MYNKIILVGNMTRDVEIKYTQAGSAIGSTGIATSRKFKSATGEQKEEVCFVDLTYFGRAAEIANQYTRKGSKILIEGRLKLDSWTAEDGSKRSKHSVIVETMKMLDSKSDGQNQGQGYSQPQQGYSQPQAQPSQNQQAASGTPPPEIDINEDEIPF